MWSPVLTIDRGERRLQMKEGRRRGRRRRELEEDKRGGRRRNEGSSWRKRVEKEEENLRRRKYEEGRIRLGKLKKQKLKKAPRTTTVDNYTLTPFFVSTQSEMTFLVKSCF